MENNLTNEEMKYIQDRAFLLVGTIYDSEFIVDQLYAEFQGWA